MTAWRQRPRVRWLALPALAGAVALGGAAAPAAIVRGVDVVVEGPIRIDPDLPRAYIGLRPGEPFDRAQITRDVRALEASGRFERIWVRARPAGEDVEVTYHVQPAPRIARIEVTGADRVGNRKVLEWMGLSLGDVAHSGRLAAAVRKVRDEYHKARYPYARVSWTLEPTEDPGRVVLRVRVEEGPRARVSRVRFEGNRVVSERELLGVLKQSRFQWYKPWHWITGAGRLEEDDVEADRYAIRQAYLDRGYLDAEVDPPEYTWIGARRLQVTYRIREGEPYAIGDVSVRGLETVPEPEIRSLLKLERGAPASARAIEDTARAVSDYYGDRGHARVRVRPVTHADPDTRTVDVVFDVQEGPVTRIRSIGIRGNTITKDHVIRRELAVMPGEIYHRGRARTSENRLLNLGYFESVESFVEPTDRPEWVDLVFDVQEQRMGQAMLSLGFSSIDQLSGAFEISHGNFDLRDWPPVGGGQKVLARTIVGTRRTDFDFSFTEPWLFGRRLALGLDLFRSEKRYLSRDYDQRNTGGSISLTHPLVPHTRLRTAYSLERIEIYNVSRTASPRIRDEEGDRIKSALSWTVSYDTRDRIFVPTRGQRAELTLALAGGPLGGDTDIYSIEGGVMQFIPLWRGHVLSLRGRAGVVDTHSGAERVPLFDRYFLGGATTLRGFKFRDVGPRDEEGVVIGGRSMAFGSAEYSVPLGGVFRAALFYDIGLVDPEAYSFSADPNSNWGVGLRIDLRMLPLRFDYAWPLKADPYNDRPSGRFSFFIGYGF